jgi:site-specific recombinase
MQDFILKVYQERNELFDKINRLRQYIYDNNIYDNLLSIQLNVMESYLSVLNARLQILDPECKCSSEPVL